jgi:hypothetical protein
MPISPQAFENVFEALTRGSVDPNLAVFINCPYDDDYRVLLDAVVFTCVCCGFYPLTAPAIGSTDDTRIARIAAGIFSSKFSIHDLSRFKGEGAELIARMNMPLELGLAMGRRFASLALSDQGLDLAIDLNALTDATRNRLQSVRLDHHWLVLIPENAPYERFISDLSGFDIKRHRDDVKSIVTSVLAWLRAHPDANTPNLSPPPVLEALKNFRIAKAQLDAQWSQDTPWADVVELAVKHARSV